jgi:hypothetical protein
MAASARTCARVLCELRAAGHPMGRGVLVKLTRYCPATVSASLQRLQRDGRIAQPGGRRGSAGLATVWEVVPVVATTRSAHVLAVPQGHPDAVWSGCLERAGLAPGLSSYAQRGSRA